MHNLTSRMDVCCMVAAFGYGALFSLLRSGVGGPNVAANAITTFLSFALIKRVTFQLKTGHKFSEAVDLNYVNTRSMLHNLVLQKYKKIFKRGLLNDSTLPLLTNMEAVILWYIRVQKICSETKLRNQAVLFLSQYLISPGSVDFGYVSSTRSILFFAVNVISMAAIQELKLVPVRG